MHSRLIFLHRLTKVDPLYVSFQGRSPLSDAGVSQDRGRFVAEVYGERSEKSTAVTMSLPVLKLTQVDEENILRRSRELRLRN